MLPPYIIEELRRREQAQREEHDRPQPQLEMPLPHERAERATPADGVKRGVAIIEVF